MIYDTRTAFGNPVALATSAPGTAVLGDQINLSVDDVNQGVGIPFYLWISAAVAATSGGAATASFQLVTADNAALTTNPVVLMQTPVYTLAQLVTGKPLFVAPIPMQGPYKKFLGIRQVTGTAAFTAGSVYALLTQEPDAWRPYPEANS